LHCIFQNIRVMSKKEPKSAPIVKQVAKQVANMNLGGAGTGPASATTSARPATAGSSAGHAAKSPQPQRAPVAASKPAAGAAPPAAGAAAPARPALPKRTVDDVRADIAKWEKKLEEAEDKEKYWFNKDADGNNYSKSLDIIANIYNQLATLRTELVTFEQGQTAKQRIRNYRRILSYFFFPPRALPRDESA